MTTPLPGDWSAVKKLFLEAVPLDAEQRKAFLAEACGPDQALRHELESLLDAHDDEAPFLDTPPLAGAARAVLDALDGNAEGAPILAPGTRIGQYEVVESVGAGGMGTVYRARDTRLDRFVALKILLESGTWRTADRVLSEARAASALNHPNICTIYEAGDAGGQPYLAMEYIAGRPLNALIPPGGFPAADVIRYGKQIAEALAHAHEHGIIHRDLKTANIVVTPDGRAKVLDFGTARRLPPAGARSSTDTTTQAGTIAGTPAYMAPELLRSQKADVRSDIWALGVLVYELAAGRRPFEGGTAFEVTSAILRDAPAPLPPSVPAAVGTVIMRCLARNPDARFGSASEVSAALEASGSTSGRVPGRSIRPAVNWGMAAMAAGVLLLVWALYQGRHGAPTTATLGVRPFTVLSGDPEIAYLGVGVPDTIFSRVALAQNVRARSLLTAVAGNDDPQTVGRRIGADYVLTGTIQKLAGRIRITPQLIRVSDGAARLTGTYTFPSSNLMRLQDEIARGVVDALPVALSDRDRARIVRQFTQNPEAYASYVRGRTGLAQNTQASIEGAVQSFQAALVQDSNYVLAHAGLAMASARMRLFFAKEDEVEAWGRRAHEAATRALEIDQDLAESHEALAAVARSTEFDWRQAIEEGTRALAGNPALDQAHFFRASAFMHLGLLDRAHMEAASAMDINPANLAEPLRVQGASAMYDGRFAAAVPLLEQASAASPAPAEWNLAYAYFYVGRTTKAETMLQQIGPRSARSHRRAQATLASFLAARNQIVDAQRLIDTVISGAYIDHHVAYSLGVAYAQLHKPREALVWLKQARTSGFPCYPWFEGDPLLAPLRDNREFKGFLEDFKEEWAMKKTQLAAVR